MKVRPCLAEFEKAATLGFRWSTLPARVVTLESTPDRSHSGETLEWRTDPCTPAAAAVDACGGSGLAAPVAAFYNDLHKTIRGTPRR